jgi:predicted Zn finger-like uncharacterized protein
MIIECTNCNKKFNVKDELIPTNGRQIKCGSCNHSWYFEIEKLSDKTPSIKSENTTHDEIVNKSNEKNFEIFSETKTSKLNENDKIKDENIIADVTNVKNKRTDQDTRKNNFFSYLLVSIISFIALIIVVDTLKSPLINLFPFLEIILFNLFETLKDVKLFIIDLT